jgi:hypothetical protein
MALTYVLLDPLELTGAFQPGLAEGTDIALTFPTGAAHDSFSVAIDESGAIASH